MSAPVRRMILNPATRTEAQTAADRLVRTLDLWGTTITSDILDGHLRTVVWTHSEADSVRLVELLRSRHVRARYSVVHDYTPSVPSNYVIINWRKLS